MVYSELLNIGIAFIAGVIGGVLTQIKLKRSANGPTDGLETRSRAFVLVDEADHQRALLRLINNDATLLLSDPAMHWALRIRVGDEGPYIYLSEGEINARIGLGITREGTTGSSAGLELAAEDGTARVILGLSAAGEGALILNDSRGRPRTKLSVSPSGYASFTFVDENGKELTRLPAANQ